MSQVFAEERVVADAFVAACGDERGAYREDRILGHSIAMCATSLDGLHTGRRRYMVVCISCQELIHEATTGPAWNIVMHCKDQLLIDRNLRR